MWPSAYPSLLFGILDIRARALGAASGRTGAGAQRSPEETDYRADRWKGFREGIKFTGKEHDTEMGLTYFGPRYYSAPLGRWISPDPVAVHGLGADLNPYAYVHGSVMSAVDPFGLDEYDPPINTPGLETDENGMWSYVDPKTGELQVGEWGPDHNRDGSYRDTPPLPQDFAERFAPSNIANRVNDAIDKFQDYLWDRAEYWGEHKREYVDGANDEAAKGALIGQLLMITTGGPPLPGGPVLGPAGGGGSGGGAAVPVASQLAPPAFFAAQVPRDKATPDTVNRSASYSSERDARSFARTVLGREPTKVEQGKLRSVDGRWQYRGKAADLAGMATGIHRTSIWSA